MLGASAALGRTLTESDGEPGARKVMVLGHEFWRNRLGADPDVLGRFLTVEEAQGGVNRSSQHRRFELMSEAHSVVRLESSNRR